MSKNTNVYKRIREINDQSQETVANGTGISRDKIGSFERNEKTVTGKYFSTNLGIYFSILRGI